MTDHTVPPVATRLSWHMGDNLRWLAERYTSTERPGRVPCGELTGAFLFKCADRLDELAQACFNNPFPPRKVFSTAFIWWSGFCAGITVAALIGTLSYLVFGP